jgi:hypothetical protein
MDVEASVAKMCAQIDALRSSAMSREAGWTIEIPPPTVYLGLKRNAEPDRVYLLRIQFDDFDRRAPSYTFVDPMTKVRTPNSCPPNVEHSEGRICTTGTRECHEQLHQNDTQYAWDAKKYSVLDTVRTIHRMMNQA